MIRERMNPKLRETISSFRYQYPNGRIESALVQPASPYVARVRVYNDKQDAEGAYMAEGHAVDDDQAVAQLMAIDIAMELVGLVAYPTIAPEEQNDLWFDAPEDFEGIPPEDMQSENPQEDAEAPQGEESTPHNRELSVLPANSGRDDAYETACRYEPGYEGKHAGKTLGEIFQDEPRLIRWLAYEYKDDTALSAAARVVWEHNAIDEIAV